MFDIVFYSAMELATAFSTSIEMLLILRALFGIGMGGEWGSAHRWRWRRCRPRRAAWCPGILQQGYAVGNLLAAVLYWTIYEFIGWRGMFIVGVIPALLVLYLRLASRNRRCGRRRGPTGGNSSRLCEIVDRALAAVSLCRRPDGLLQFVESRLAGPVSDLPKVQHHLGPAAVGAITVVANLGAIIGGVFFGAYSETIGRSGPS